VQEKNGVRRPLRASFRKKSRAPQPLRASFRKKAAHRVRCARRSGKKPRTAAAARVVPEKKQRAASGPGVVRPAGAGLRFFGGVVQRPVQPRELWSDLLARQIARKWSNFMRERLRLS
jgi:hypothetical protein